MGPSISYATSEVMNASLCCVTFVLNTPCRAQHLPGNPSLSTTNAQIDSEGAMFNRLVFVVTRESERERERERLIDHASN
jgi:hypothetical protein